MSDITEAERAQAFEDIGELFAKWRARGHHPAQMSAWCLNAALMVHEALGFPMSVAIKSVEQFYGLHQPTRPKVKA